jgi:ferric-dicitrate binding protein FerR (iron transport regulator)
MYVNLFRIYSTFSIVFAAGERTVQITGEAYFEVAHNAGKPFRVEVKGMKLKYWAPL